MLVGQQWQWVPYVRQMQAQIKAQMDRMEQLEKNMELLKTELQACKEQKRIHIDKIEYKFDQLKVERLDGTMNIGLTPGALEDLSVDGQSGPISVNPNTNTNAFDKNGMEVHNDQLFQSPLGLRGEIGKELHNYLEEQVPKHMDRLQQQSGQQLDEWHRKMIQEDLNKQLDARMDYYLHQMGQGVNVDQLSSIKDSVLFRTQNDIRSALQQYFDRMPKKGGEAG
jgi:spore germination protein PC